MPAPPADETAGGLPALFQEHRAVRSTDVAVIGAGQGGLSVSQVLSTLGIEHVVFERGRVAEAWRSARWDSLRLLTPNWMSRLPVHAYRGADPDGFMTMPEITAFLADYARRIGAPVLERTEVRAVTALGAGYLVATDQGSWRCRALVVATGHCETPAIPAFAAKLAPRLHQTTAARYRRPAALPAGGVLVVGAAASGLQIAEELRLAGRAVMLAAGRHTRLPRRYRGRDIWWWMDRAGVLEDRASAERDIARARSLPSPQLVGGTPARDLDLGTLRAMGVRVLGRLRDAGGERIALADDLAETVAGARRPMEALLARVDPVADALGAPRGERPAPLTGFGGGPTALDLRAEGIASIVWATGYRRDHPWLHLPGLRDAAGELRHDGGVTAAPGLFLIGANFMRRRSSSFLGGVGADAAEIAALIARHLGQTPARAA